MMGASVGSDSAPPQESANSPPRSRAPLLPRLRVIGADATVRDGQVVVRHAARVPPDLMAEARQRRADLLTELEAEKSAFDSADRAAIVAEGQHGDALAEVVHLMPPSWASTSPEPTAGAMCRNCRGRHWWTEASEAKGWRCCICHPADHLPTDRRRTVRT